MDISVVLLAVCSSAHGLSAMDVQTALEAQPIENFRKSRNAVRRWEAVMPFKTSHSLSPWLLEADKLGPSPRLQLAFPGPCRQFYGENLGFTVPFGRPP